MKEKLLKALKAAYANLGFSEDALSALAETLAPLATEDSMQTMVDSQKPYLEAMQRANDKRATDAAKKAKDENAKIIEALNVELSKLKKSYEELQQQAGSNQKDSTGSQTQTGEKGVQNEVEPKWFTEYKSQQESTLREVLAKNKELEDALTDVKNENEKFRVDAGKARRRSFIDSEAKRLGVPSWRVDEGFSITDDMDEKAITEYISRVANNVKVNTLPPEKDAFMKMGDGVSIEDVDKIASSLLN